MGIIYCWCSGSYVLAETSLSFQSDSLCHLSTTKGGGNHSCHLKQENRIALKCNTLWRLVLRWAKGKQNGSERGLYCSFSSIVDIWKNYIDFSNQIDGCSTFVQQSNLASSLKPNVNKQAPFRNVSNCLGALQPKLYSLIKFINEILHVKLCNDYLYDISIYGYNGKLQCSCIKMFCFLRRNFV